MENGAGFGGAHLVNYFLQMVLLNFFIWLGFSATMAPIGVYAVSIPVNFLLVRFVFKHFKRKGSKELEEDKSAENATQS